MAAARSTPAAGADDVVRVSPVKPGERVTVLLDGVTGTGCADDEVHAAPPPVPSALGTLDVDVGNVLPSTRVCASEIIAFAKNHAVLLDQNLTWTPDADVLSEKLSDLIEVPVSIRIVWGGSMRISRAQLIVKAATDLDFASELYNSQDGGVRFTLAMAVTDVSSRAAAGLSVGDCADRAALKQLGFDPGRLNVYYLDMVAGEKTGRWCGGADFNEPDMILIGAHTEDPETLAHEFGHAFTLSHTSFTDSGGQTEVLPQFSAANLMAPGPNRSDITNGQVFRVHVNDASSLNRNHNRPSGPTRSCPDTPAAPRCPALELDLPK